MLKTDSWTREHLTSVQGAGCRPESAHSEIPKGALMDVLFAASMKCSEMIFMVHSPVSTRFRSVSLAFEKPPANPTMKIGGS